ncbi:hypothetical protein DC498_02345 [Terrimonas sp.]|uniref:T9SS type A sorting domain-containing protein n=1 Tax=Terrimonas sp. TaxID=1914338 RepID=UPI000D51D5A0|nr:T9SS type A sorting domain-containing protein [Terrimonas sp.]PVD54240.1 hypothetical protein DC498_02345 [Terrimonas sp.]
MSRIITSLTFIFIGAFVLFVNPVTAGEAHTEPWYTFKRTTAHEQSFRMELKKKKEGLGIQLLLLKTEGKKVWVRLLNPDGVQISSFMTKNSGRVVRDFNLNDADAGIYTFEVSDKNQKIVSRFEIKQSSESVFTRIIVE